MKFEFMVKHNGILYPAGKRVPIGVEPKKENEINDKTATEIKQELKDVYGITKFNTNKKTELAKMLKEAEEAKAEQEAKEELEAKKEAEVKEEEGNESEEKDKTLLDKIIDEE